MSRYRLAAAIAAVATCTAPALATGPLTMTSRVMVEQRSTAADGSTRTALVPAKRAVPGQRILVVLAYRNTGTQALGDVVLANPVPAHVAYRDGGTGSAAPEVSVDGRTFGPLATLRVGLPGGATRAATPDDVTHVRWRLSSPLGPGQAGERTFQAVLK